MVKYKALAQEKCGDEKFQEPAKELSRVHVDNLGGGGLANFNDSQWGKAT